MRAAVVCCTLALAVFGCHGPCTHSTCCFPGGPQPCESPAALCGPEAAAPAPSCPSAKPPPPAVEVRGGGGEIHVKAPPQKITIPLPSPAGPCAESAPATCAPDAPPAAPSPPAAAPAPVAMVPQPYGYAPQAVTAGPAAAPMDGITSTEQRVSPPRARLGISFEVFHLPIPYPRLVALPGEQEIVTRQRTEQVIPAAPPLQAVPVAAAPAVAAVPVAAAPAPVYAAPA